MAGRKTAVFGIYQNVKQAERTVDDLLDAGFSNDDISVLLPDKKGTKDFAHDKSTKAPEGTTAGVTTGGVIGGTLGLLAGIGVLAIPGVGPLIAGCLAEWVSDPLTVPYLVILALGAIALLGLSVVPETGTPTRRGTAERSTRSRRRVRLPVPAAAATLAAFSANGLFAGLSGLFLATTFGRPSHALSGATLFLVFSCGVASQLATVKLRASRVLGFGTLSMLFGLVLLVVSVRLSTPSLALFLIGGALIGAGAGAVFKGTTGIVLEASAPEDRVAMTSALLIALFVGLSVPVIGAGIALNQGASAPNTVLVFAVLVGLGVSASGWALLGRRAKVPSPE